MNEIQSPALINNDLEIPDGQKENPGSPRDDDIETGHACDPMNSDVIATREA